MDQIDINLPSAPRCLAVKPVARHPWFCGEVPNANTLTLLSEPRANNHTHSLPYCKPNNSFPLSSQNALQTGGVMVSLDIVCDRRLLACRTSVKQPM